MLYFMIVRKSKTKPAGTKLISYWNLKNCTHKYYVVSQDFTYKQKQKLQTTKNYKKKQTKIISMFSNCIF